MDAERPFREAVALANDRGVVRTRDLTDIGVPRCYLVRMCEEGLLIKVGYGLLRGRSSGCLVFDFSTPVAVG
jgi:hypothetical protein